MILRWTTFLLTEEVILGNRWVKNFSGIFKSLMENKMIFKPNETSHNFSEILSEICSEHWIDMFAIAKCKFGQMKSFSKFSDTSISKK